MRRSSLNCARRATTVSPWGLREQREWTVSSHNSRPMMMYQQPLIPDALEEICGYHLRLLRFVRLMGGNVLHADDPGHIAGHLHRHVGELERHGKGIIEDQDPRVAHPRPARPQRPAGMDAGHVFLVRPNLIHLVDVEVAKRGIE